MLISKVASIATTVVLCLTAGLAHAQKPLSRTYNPERAQPDKRFVGHYWDSSGDVTLALEEGGTYRLDGRGEHLRGTWGLQGNQFVFDNKTSCQYEFATNGQTKNVLRVMMCGGDTPLQKNWTTRSTYSHSASAPGASLSQKSSPNPRLAGDYWDASGKIFLTLKADGAYSFKGQIESDSKQGTWGVVGNQIVFDGKACPYQLKQSLYKPVIHVQCEDGNLLDREWFLRP